MKYLSFLTKRFIFNRERVLVSMAMSEIDDMCYLKYYPKKVVWFLCPSLLIDDNTPTSEVGYKVP